MLIGWFDALPKTMAQRMGLIRWSCFPVVVYKVVQRPLRSRAGSPPGIVPPPATPAYPEDAARDACVRYSGGTDSTLAAALMAERFRKVHLLTFASSEKIPLQLVRSDPRSSVVHLEALRKKYGQDKFEHHIIPMSALRDRVYFNHYQPLFPEKNYLRVSFCPACTMAMHLETIAYCRNRGIHHVSDGGNAENGRFESQTQHPANLEAVQRFYARFGIAYEINPGYRDGRSDRMLHAMGILEQPDVKHDFHYRRRTQQFCLAIQFQALCRKLHGRDENAAACRRFFDSFAGERFAEYQAWVTRGQEG